MPATPEDNPVLDIVNEDDAPLGEADIDDDDGSEDIVDDIVPEGVAEIQDNKTLDTVKVNEDKAPLGTLPKTGGNSGSGLVLFGTVLLGLGVWVRRRFR